MSENFEKDLILLIYADFIAKSYLEISLVTMREYCFLTL